MISTIEQLLWLLFAHYVFDFGLQTPFLSEYKYKSLHVMFAHVMIYTGGVMLVWRYFDLPNPFTVAVILFASHFVMDWLKGVMLKSTRKEHEAVWFHLDQWVHIIILMWVVVCLA